MGVFLDKTGFSKKFFKEKNKKTWKLNFKFPIYLGKNK